MGLLPMSEYDSLPPKFGWVKTGKSMESTIGDDSSWYNGPPYAVAEIVIDENDLMACCLAGLEKI